MALDDISERLTEKRMVIDQQYEHKPSDVVAAETYRITPHVYIRKSPIVMSAFILQTDRNHQLIPAADS